MTPSAPHQAPSSGSSSRALRLLTWNVGEVYWPWHGNQLKDRDVDHVSSVIRAIDPDVVLLQELANADQVAPLAGDHYAGAVSVLCGYDRHVAVLVRAGLSPRFTDALLAPTRRGIVGAHFMFSGRSVSAFSLHFDVFHPTRRLAQAQAAAALLDADPSDLVVAGGDLNYDPDVSERLGREEDRKTEALLLTGRRDVATAAGPTLVGFMRVDRVFAGGSALGRADATVCPQRTPLGDHAPLLCGFELAVDGSENRP